MSANRHRHAQKFPVVYVALGIAALLCIASFAVKTLLISQQIKLGEDRLIRIRKQVAELRTANTALTTKKAQLTSIPAITRAIKDGTIKMIPIEDRFVIRVGAVRNGVASADPMSAAGRGR